MVRCSSCVAKTTLASVSSTPFRSGFRNRFILRSVLFKLTNDFGSLIPDYLDRRIHEAKFPTHINSLLVSPICSVRYPFKSSSGTQNLLFASAAMLEWKRNVMAHAQKPDLVFQRSGRVHLYLRGCQFSRLLAAEVCASAVVMLDRPCSHTVQDCWLPTPFASFPFTSPPVRRRVPSDSVSTLPVYQTPVYCRKATLRTE